jgi:hypothetical protein
LFSWEFNYCITCFGEKYVGTLFGICQFIMGVTLLLQYLYFYLIIIVFNGDYLFGNIAQFLLILSTFSLLIYDFYDYLKNKKK